MDWLRRLNQQQVRVPLGCGAVAEVLNWAYNPALPDNALHRHTYFEVCRVGGHGRGIYLVQDREHEIGPGDVFVARPGVIHQIRNTQTPWMELFWVAYQIAPSGHELPSELRQFAESPIVVSPDPGGRVAAVWDALRAVAASGPDQAARHLASALFLTIAEALAPPRADASPPNAPSTSDPSSLASPGWSPADATIRLAVRYVHDNLDRPLRGQEVARQAGVSTRHLSRLFRQFAGVSFYAYVTRARIDRAVHLLRRTDLPVKEVGAQVGYPDVHHFTRVFRHTIGSPPAAFRKGMANRNVPIIQTPGAFV